MSRCVRLLSKRTFKVDARKFSTVVCAKDIPVESVQSFRTLQDDPVLHNATHYNRFYTIPQEIYDKLLKSGVPKEFSLQVDTFTECSLLIRKPALEIISYLNGANYTKAINKYVMHGITGAGKTITFLHILHYALSKKMVLLHVPWPATWCRFPKEVAPSPIMPEMFDLPIEAGIWLKNFKHLNEGLLSESSLRVSKDYEWSKWEVTKSGTPLLEMIDFGIARIKFSCGIINALIQELKAACTAGKCRMLVAIDGFNALLSEQTGVRDENKQCVSANKLTLTEAFLNSVKYDWCNGAAVLTVDTRACKEKRESNLPLYLLGKKGFEHLDPFLPIAVENYTTDEFETVLEYYKNRKWLRNITRNGEEEIALLSNRNPWEVYHVSRGL